MNLNGCSNILKGPCSCLVNCPQLVPLQTAELLARQPRGLRVALERGANLGAQLLRVVGGVVGEEELGQRAVDAERALEASPPSQPTPLFHSPSARSGFVQHPRERARAVVGDAVAAEPQRVQRGRAVAGRERVGERGGAVGGQVVVPEVERRQRAAAAVAQRGGERRAPSSPTSLPSSVSLASVALPATPAASAAAPAAPRPLALSWR